MDNTQPSTPQSETQPSFIPPRTFHRNEHGLIDDGSVTYVYNDDGTINWRKMINPTFLVPNKQRFEERNKPVPKSIEGLEDRDLLILLGGIKELAHIRGYVEVEHTPVAPSADYVLSVCKITWIPNFETNYKQVAFSAIGDATPFNTTSFTKSYLGPMAENRAFVRAVRNFLRINIVSQEELGAKNSEKTADVAQSVLQEIMDKHGVTFEKVKQKLIEEVEAKTFPIAEGEKNPADYESIDDIPKYKQFELVERIKTRAATKSQS